MKYLFASTGNLLLRLLAASLLVCPLSAQFEDVDSPEGQRVTDIEVRYVGERTVDEARILANMNTRVGSAYSRETASDDVKRLFEFGIADILTESYAGGVRVIVLIQTRAALSDVVFQGNSALPDSRLRQEVEIDAGASVDEVKLQEAVFNIEEIYRKRGYSDISVSYRIEQDPRPGFSRVIFFIEEGQRNRLRSILFQGNASISAAELRGVMEIKEKGLIGTILPFTRRGKIDNNVLEEDLLRIEEEYRNHGFLNARVTDLQRLRIEKDPDRVDLLIIIEEGPQFSVGNVRIEGASAFGDAELVPLLKLNGGMTYSAKTMREDIERLEDYYGSRGYADFRVQPRIENAGPNVVNLTYVLREGEISYIRLINISGNEETKDEVARRELAIQPGELYNSVKLRTSRRRLENTGFFSAVEILPSDTEQAGYKDVNINLTEQQTGNISVGAGFSSIDNVVGFIDITQSNADITDFPWRSGWPWFTGDGQKMRLGIRFGTQRSDFIFSHTEPWFLERRLALTNEIYFRDADFLSDDYTERRYGYAVSLRKPVTEASFVTLEYRIQNVEIYDIDRKASDIIAAEEGEFLESKLSLEFTHDTRDSFFLPRTGHRFTAGVSVSGGPLGAEVDNYNVNLGFTQHVSLPWDTIFTLETNVAVVDGLSSGDDVPIFNRLFLGGAYDLRGFNYRDVGPKDQFGEPIGGQTLASATLEFTFPIVERVRGAVFYDVGFVNPDSFDFSSSDYNSDVGIGVRLYLPIGPIRLDYGIPLESDDENDSSGKFNFNLGYQF
ncbi:MAG TPA: outer membrane protein assembly factor BamA [Verrucomicrobiales bacterium]|nr:outer membrane protein assembly factor BamA [Verrucomicrobiales bacterium]